VTAVQDKERPITARIAERPALDVGKLREVRPRDLAIRFVAGALTSIAAGLLTLAFGARVGGILLAFPAILGASLTLIEDQEDSIEAREDARGAVVGGCALALFAAIAALTLGHINPVLALLLATAAWFAGALLGYLLAWFR
jgi:Protein of unknown function (DUF3147)